MSRLQACILVFGIAGHAVGADENASQAVLPAIVYRDNVFLHHRERGEGYALVVKPFENSGITITFQTIVGSPRNDFESLFVRGRVLVYGINDYMNSTAGGSYSTYRAIYLSPDRLCDAKLVFVEPTGEPVEPDAFSKNPPNAMWGRKGPAGSPRPGKTGIVHTALAAFGKRDLLAFDLTRTGEAKGMPPPPSKVVITRIIPEEWAPTGDPLTNWGNPEVKPFGEISSAFNEPFQAYLLGDDCYFLTKSGSVYRSPPVEKGKPRTMAATWDNKKQPPVRFIISDGNRTGVHFLIYYRERVGWEYFQFTPEPKALLLTAYAPSETEKPTEAVYELARVLRDKKLIVTPPKKP